MVSISQTEDTRHFTIQALASRRLSLLFFFFYGTNTAEYHPP